MEQFTYIDIYLNAMRDIDIQDVDPSVLPDIRDINIDSSKPILNRAVDFIIQSKNTRFVRCGNILIQLEYADTDTSIEDCVIRHFNSSI